MPAPALSYRNLPYAVALGFALLAVTGLLWTPVAPAVQDWLMGQTGADPAARPKGFVLSTVVLVPLLITVWASLRLVPAIRVLRSAGLLSIFAVSAAATLAWHLFGPEGSPEISYAIALFASWFILINRP